jgi:microcystin-dependent protein
MPLVFRTDQSTPLTNEQVDNNFKFLRDEINLKYTATDFTAAQISLKLRTTAPGQTSIQLSQANALNAWVLRDLAPSSTLPIVTDKSSVVTRNSSGNIEVANVTGTLLGNATSATSATTATQLATARQINGVNFDGTSDITIVDATKLPLSGGSLVGKLNLPAAINARAPINLGVGVNPDAANLSNGDLWTTGDGLYYRIAGQTDKVAPVFSPEFSGIPKAPGFDGTSSQIITLTHLNNAVTTLNNSIALKANTASPALTGVPTAPTATAGTNSAQIATTSFVTTAISNSDVSVTSAYQSYTNNAVTTLSNSVNVLLNAKANLASPNLTGVPTAPTAPVGTNSVQIATTEFTKSEIAAVRALINGDLSVLRDLINATRPVPSGSVFFIASTVVPYGYLECNGEWVDKTTYQDLWVALGSPPLGTIANAGKFKLPDLRGEFIRGWDNGRGVDLGREIRTAQADELKSHTHAIGYYPNLRGVGGGANISDGDAAFKNTTATGGTETRPRNIALMPIIKW